MIIEGLLTTQRADGSPHIAPMGPLVNPELTQWRLRPFQSSTTFQLLRAHPECVFHVVDDVVLVVQAALNLPMEVECQRSATGGWIIPSACHWYQLRVDRWDVSQPRSEVEGEVVAKQQIRPFWGWNRAKHAVLEATILATRLHLTGRAAVLAELAQLQSAVDKTAGPREQFAWRLLHDYIATH